jgi:hypothetical protein
LKIIHLCYSFGAFINPVLISQFSKNILTFYFVIGTIIAIFFYLKEYPAEIEQNKNIKNINSKNENLKKIIPK